MIYYYYCSIKKWLHQQRIFFQLLIGQHPTRKTHPTQDRQLSPETTHPTPDITAPKIEDSSNTSTTAPNTDDPSNTRHDSSQHGRPIQHKTWQFSTVKTIHSSRRDYTQHRSSKIRQHIDVLLTFIGHRSDGCKHWLCLLSTYIPCAYIISQPTYVDVLGHFKY